MEDAKKVAPKDEADGRTLERLSDEDRAYTSLTREIIKSYESRMRELRRRNAIEWEKGFKIGWKQAFYRFGEMTMPPVAKRAEVKDGNFASETD